MKRQIKSGIIIYNEDKPLATELYLEYKKYLEEKNIEVLDRNQIENGDFVIVIGGDGTLLRASKTIIKNENIDVFAVNAGSLGFLTEIKKEEFKSTFENYLDGKYITEERVLLKVKYGDEIHHILNEVVVSKNNALSKLIHIRVEVGDITLFTLKADGIIVATPTGSTAYSLSAGGPILSPSLEVVLLTPLAPHNLTTRPIVLSTKENIKISLLSGDVADIILDGDISKKLTNDNKIELYSCNKKIRLVLPKNRNYYSVLHDKLKWSE